MIYKLRSEREENEREREKGADKDRWLKKKL